MHLSMCARVRARGCVFIRVRVCARVYTGTRACSVCNMRMNGDTVYTCYGKCSRSCGGGGGGDKFKLEQSQFQQSKHDDVMIANYYIMAYVNNILSMRYKCQLFSIYHI